TLARRELRGGIRPFRLLVGCLALGVAAIAAIGSTRAALFAGLRADARTLLGGDLELSSTTMPLDEAEVSAISVGNTLSRTTELRAMARHGDVSTLVELKAVDGTYPLYGVVETEPAFALREALTGGGALVDPTLAARLALKVGDPITIGDASLVVRGVLTHEPDRGIRGFELGPRVMVAPEAVAATGLVQPGSLVRYSYRVKLADTVDAENVAAPLRARLAGVRVVTHTDATPGVKRFIDRVTQFLTLVGLTALLVGGVGVSNAVSTFIESKLSTIATLKCVGAASHTVTAVYLWLTGLLASLGIVIGLLVGALAPVLVLPLVAQVLPVVARGGVYWQPLAQAAAFGAVTAMVFALWPLARVSAVKPAALFRAQVTAARARPTGGMLAATVAGLLVLVALVVSGARDASTAVAFVGAVSVSFIVFATMARIAARLATWLTVRMPASPLRVGLGGVARNATSTNRTAMTLGLGLTVLAAIAVIESNLSRELGEGRTTNPPAFFFVDIQAAEATAFNEQVSVLPGVTRIDSVPMLRGRILAVDGKSVETLAVPERSRWAIESDRGLTYAARPPEATRLVEGAWWAEDYAGPPLVSFDAELARDLGVTVGDTLTFSILGRELTATIASLRDIDWRGMNINFTVVLSPGALAGAPHTVLATAHVDAAHEETVFARVAKDFPHVSTVRVREGVTRLQSIMAAIGAAVRSAAALTLLMGILVLAGGIIATQTQRVQDAVIFKVVGATRATAAGVFLAEHGLTGFATAVVASLLGSGAAYGVLVGLMDMPWQPAPGALAATLVFGTMASLAVGAIATWSALGKKPAALLRDE
ncbi:MAG TPA: FtsX-like permease family protein, partial [Myxococcota bacterium]|nr:FtsX-like permease family protein [Myxococcota bacterium]